MPHMTAGERALHFFGRPLVRFFYRVHPLGLEHLPEGGFLLLPNHITWVDALVLQFACPRPIRYIVDQEFYQKPMLRSFMRAVGCIPIDVRHSRSAIRAATEQIAAGEIVCLFPEGQLTRSGTLLRLRRGYELIAQHANAPVVPVWLDRLWGSVFSFQGGKFFYSRRPSLDRHLAEECLRGLKRRRFSTAVIDGIDNSELSRAKLLGAAAALSRFLRKEFSDPRIAIVLPAGKGSMVANLAVTLARKVAVDLNFTAGRTANESACKRADLRVAITATAFMARVKDFPWPQRMLKLDELMPRLKSRILFWWMMSIFAPTRLLLRLLQVPKRGGHDEAIILFTSGSSGEPKGVVLSHRNIVGNVSQFRELLDARKEDAILASLPFFHSFGSTVTLWYPLIEGVRIVAYPKPLECAKNSALIEKYKLTLLLATPTFLRGYLRKAEPEQLPSLRLVITGAEKLPLDLAKAFEERFKQRVFEGYGLTETSPVVSVNLPEPLPRRPGEQVQPSSCLGSVGKMAPGIAAEIRAPETDRKLSLHETGMVWFRGVNVFEGYLK